ncbi:MAG: 3'(2'),5'-bisphosphate nucleotidase [candidate division NC10 bacterium]|nr:3'(2'),5'-bisphosphate nucleotidase [candidate division NC10 bacterium]MCH7897148.1 3'(2'),5'-bisphosphate nucleotidase [candidate division NC10 bacterium]MCZ6550665.1 3'(2'),5'-bisphosphate nucleotidase [candidate division NC10 bacterium]
MGYEVERRVAVGAVLKACHLCQDVRAALVSEETTAKQDKSPVTVADFGAQAVINLDLLSAFPEDPIIAEEDAAFLRSPGGASLKTKVAQHVTAILPGLTDDQILDAIDRGTWGGGPIGRHWTVDPIDGTKGFLRGDQYAVALALIEDGKVVLGVLGCPNLPVEASHRDGPRGCLFIALKGEGTTIRRLDAPTEKRIRVTEIGDPARASLCESFEDSHSSHNRAVRIAAILGMTAPPLRIDSQCKYAAIARGDVSIYVRLPPRATYEDKIWDHTAGWIVVKEAGGEVSDVRGQPLDFSLGRKLSQNIGIVATNGKLHPQVIAAVQQALESD